MTSIVWRHLTSSSSSSKLVLASGAIGAAFLYQHLLGSIEHGADRDGPGGLIGPLIAIGASLALAILNVDRRYADVWVPLRVLMWGTGLVVFVQALFDAFHPAAFQSNVFIGIFPDARLLIGMCALAGVIALWRPAFLLPMFLAYCAFRYRVPTLFRLPTPSVDFATIVDVGQFPAFVLNVLWLGGRVAPLQSFLGSNEIRIEKLLWAVGVGVHVGNYFHSGLAKVWAGGPDPFFWVFHNPVQQAVAIGLFRMSNPLAAWPSALFAYTVTLSNVAIAINIVVLAAQIFAPIGLLRRRWLIGLTLFFDAMHIGIYLSLGALFFFWIALNVVILASLALMNDRDFSVTLRGTAMFCALVGFMSFSTATLGWLDGKKVVWETFVADTTNGDSVIVPPAAYGLFSYQIGHGDLYVPDGHFPSALGPT